MKCKKCKKDQKIVNKFHGLCLKCNNKRLGGGKSPKVYNYIGKDRKAQEPQQNRIEHKVKEGTRVKRIFGGRRAGKTWAADDVFYKICFDESDHKCEECGTQLPTEFANDKGKVQARFRYSHIIAKSIAPELRHNPDNINHLCLQCHMSWEFSDRKNMKIYEKNRKKFPGYLK